MHQVDPERVRWQGHDVEVRRSARRTRTVSARVEGGLLVVQAPATLARARLDALLDELLPRVLAREANREDPQALARRARRLARAYLGGRVRPSEIRWVPPMRTRWASCTPATGVIRVSETLRHAPPWVLDSVVLHELAHLEERGHGPRFQALVAADPHLERSDAYLLGLAHGARLDIGGLGGEPEEG